MNKDNFKKDVERGKVGEELVAAALAARGHKVDNVSDDWEYRRIDIDLLLTSASGSFTTLEVKTDDASERTGNVFVEYANQNNYNHNYQGWYCYCQATYIAFVQQNKHKAHIVSRYDLINNINSNNYRTASSYNACGFLMPITDLVKAPSYFLLEL